MRNTMSSLLIAGVALLSTLTFGMGSVARGEGVDYFRKQIEPFMQLPRFVAPGPAFDARKCVAGKSMLSIPVSSANPFTKNIEDAMEGVAKKVGLKYINWQNQGQPTQWVQGMNHAINEKVNLIDLLAGTDPRQLVPQTKAALDAKIPVVASHYSGKEQKVAYASHSVPIDYFKAGQLLVDWAVVSTKGHLNALVMISTGPLSTDSMMAGIEHELKKCEDCKTKVLNVLVTDWSTRLQPTVQSALLADPTVNYIIVIYDSMSQFIVPAVEITGSQNRVKINAFNGTPFVLGLVQQGKVEMDIGENLDWIGHSIMDAEMRIICGLTPVDDPKIPFYIFDKNNADSAGKPPQLSTGYGKAYVEGFNKLWGLTK